VNGSTSTGVLETSQEGSTLFVLSSRYPAKVAYTLDVNGEDDLANGTAILVKSHPALTEPVSLALLTVQVLSNRNLPTILDVTGPPGVNIVSSSAVGVNQTASFFLPTGTYTVTGSQANESQSAQTSVKAGLADYLTLTFKTVVATPASEKSSYVTFEIILVATAVVAAVTIVAVRVLRVLRSRSLRARMANLQVCRGSQGSPGPGPGAAAAAAAASPHTNDGGSGSSSSLAGGVPPLLPVSLLLLIAVVGGVTSPLLLLRSALVRRASTRLAGRFAHG
jgi:hypothetical protein